jgi:2-phosphosulfolactate phosphatase
MGLTRCFGNSTEIMSQTLHVHFLPQLVTAEELAGGTVVVLDILRASTTITTALVNGATRVLPCQEVNAALALAQQYPRDQVLLGGERGGLKIEGFDLGNSPAEYPAERVRDKTLIFTTTNGTLAMMRCQQASQVLIGSFVNLSALCKQLLELPRQRAIHLLCAGTGGQITREDVLGAGAIAMELVAAREESWSLNDQALLALDAWQQAMQFEQVSTVAQEEPTLQWQRQQLESALRMTQGGRNLQRLGLASDLPLAAELNRFAVVPQLELSHWEIVLS